MNRKDKNKGRRQRNNAEEEEAWRLEKLKFKKGIPIFLASDKIYCG